MDNIWQVLVISLFLTVIFEEMFVIILRLRDKRTLLLIALINLLTNPPAVLSYYLFRQYTNYSTLFFTVVVEVVVIFVEFLYMKGYGKEIKHPFWLAISINIFSYTIGKVINIILG